ncbi:MAG TPA: OmpA family protein [Luteolibacter sp.]|nr:OmpA family protein [Luteolibacter sp.]
MAEGYSWNYARSTERNRLPGPEHLGWWAAAAMLLSLLLHVLVFLMLERLEFAWSVNQPGDLNTSAVNIKQVKITPMDDPVKSQPENLIDPPRDPAVLMDEIDLLAALPENPEVDINTKIDQASFALQMAQPKALGETAVARIDPAVGRNVTDVFPELGTAPANLPPAAVGQMVIDPGAKVVDDGFDSLNDELLKGYKEGVPGGVLDGLTSLDKLLVLPPNVLITKKTMLPSDLLFEFNSAELRESARLGLQKLAFLMDRNPELYCWIEGHTDLIGGDQYNLDLSLRRANAVKAYLVKIGMEPKQIITRGFGRQQPIVTKGDADAQAPNRRVEVRMRKTPPEDGAGLTVPLPPEAAPNPQPPAPPVEPEPPRAVLVRPGQAIPVEEPRTENAPVATPVIPEDVPRATPIDEREP